MNEKIKTFLAHTTNVAITGIATAAGTAVAGPDGAVVGSMVGQSVTGVLGEFAERMLSARETQRVLVTAELTIADIRQRLSSGDRPRDDGFFDRATNGRSQAEEIFEGVLLKAKAEHEEKKTRCYSRIFTTAAFQSNVSHSSANYYLHLTESLTYTQLVLLELFGEAGRFKLRDVEYATVSPDQLAAIAAAFELFRRGMILCRHKDPESKGTEYLLEMGELRPAHLSLTALGNHVRVAAGLREIDQNDLNEMACLLQ